MTRSSSVLLLRGLAADLVAWCSIPLLFLYFCVTRGLLPGDAVAPHLRLVLLPLVVIWLLRLALATAHARPVVARLATAATASLLLCVLGAYYAVVAIGLQSWGRVVSSELITSYATQVPMLADTLEVPLPAVIAAVALSYAVLLGAAWIHLRYFDWTPALHRVLSPGLRALVGGAAAACVAIEVYAFVLGPPTDRSEPVSLTFHPNDGALDFQGHAVEHLRAERLDAEEDRARAAYRAAPSASRANVILIVVDALRADHMGIYGYARDTTPGLARLEKEQGMRKLAGMRSVCASSFCGILGIIASKYVHELSARPFTLQEALRLHGYAIHMILSGDHTRFYGLRKAYGPVDAYYDAYVARAGDQYGNDDSAMLAHLAAYPAFDGRPVMMQFHLMSAHPLHLREGLPVRYAPAANYRFHHDDSADGRPGPRSVNYYDNGVFHADSAIHSVLETLRRKGYLRNALVVITADHGEAIGEEGVYGHSNNVREGVLRVPFLLVCHGRRPSAPLRNRTFASQVDIAPTILAELGLPRPATWEGTPLQAVPPRREYLPFQERWEEGVYDLRDAGNLWKYWVDARSGREFAFNLTRDPEEHNDVLDALPAALRRQLRAEVIGRGPSSSKLRLEEEISSGRYGF